MTSQLLLDKADLELTLEDSQDKDNESADNIASYHEESLMKSAYLSEQPGDSSVNSPSHRTGLPSQWRSNIVVIIKSVASYITSFYVDFYQCLCPICLRLSRGFTRWRLA